MRRLCFPGFAALLLITALRAAPARAGCAFTHSAPDLIIISTSNEGACDRAQLRAGLTHAIQVAEAGARSRDARPGAFARQQRTTRRALFRLATAPPATAPTTRLVMPTTR